MIVYPAIDILGGKVVRMTRGDFESWIAEDASEMSACVDRLLARAGVAAKDVDQVALGRGELYCYADLNTPDPGSVNGDWRRRRGRCRNHV